MLVISPSLSLDVVNSVILLWSQCHRWKSFSEILSEASRSQLWLKKKDRLAASSVISVGYEPNLSLMATSRPSDGDGDDRRRGRSADAQLDDLIEQHPSSTGSRMMGAVGGLLQGLLPAPASGQILSGHEVASGRTGGRHGPGVRSVRVEGASSSRAVESGVRRGDQPSGPTDGELFLQVSPPRETAEPGAAGMASTLAAGAAEGALAGGGGIAAEGPLNGDAAVLEQDHAADDGAFGDLAGNEVPASLDNSGENLGIAREVVEGVSGTSRVGEVLVNPFWSPERKAFERLHFGQSGYGDFTRVGSFLGGSPGEPEVEMDPIALFRMRCFREAEERFREGLLRMVQPPSTPRSFASVAEQSSSGGPPKPPVPRLRVLRRWTQFRATQCLLRHLRRYPLSLQCRFLGKILREWLGKTRMSR